MKPSVRRLLIGVAVVLVVIIAAFIALIARLQWASRIPSRPSTLPGNAIWLWAPPAAFDLTPRGYWLACWLDQTRDVNRCEITDYNGKIDFIADYSPVAGTNPVPESRIDLTAMHSSELWTAVGEELVPVAVLKDGTVLVPTQYLTELRLQYLHPGKKESP